MKLECHFFAMFAISFFLAVSYVGAAVSVPEVDQVSAVSALSTPLEDLYFLSNVTLTPKPNQSDDNKDEILALRVRMFDELTAVSKQIEDLKEQVALRQSSAGRSEKEKTSVPTVPFFSQFGDIASPQWQKVGCGIASVAMLIEYYNPGQAEVETLLQQGRASGYFLSDAGWTHAGLIALSKPFGLVGESKSLAELSEDAAFAELTKVVKEGPVMASVHYTFEPTNPIPHLVVINGVKDGKVYYNDPAEKQGGGNISIEKFQRAWKQRYIEIRPVS